MRRDFTKASTVEGFWRELQRGRGGHCRGVREGFCGGILKKSILWRGFWMELRRVRGGHCKEIREDFCSGGILDGMN